MSPCAGALEPSGAATPRIRASSDTRISIGPLPFGGHGGGLGPTGPYAAPDGGWAYAHYDPATGTASFARYASDGTQLVSIPSASVWPYGITFGTDDAAYVAGKALSGTEAVVVRIDTGGHVSTTASWPGSIAATNIGWGSDGQLYVSVDRNNLLYLDRVDPVTGAIGMDLALGANNGLLAVRPGVVTWVGGGIRFIPVADPSRERDVAWPNPPGQSSPNDPALSIGPDGSVYTMFGPAGDQTCADATLARVDPVGTASWSVGISHLLGTNIGATCTILEVGGLPDGGAVLTVLDQSQVVNRVLVAWVDASGNLMHPPVVPSFGAGSSPSESHLDIDGNGLAVLTTTVNNNCDPAQPTTVCQSVAVNVYDHGTSIFSTTLPGTATRSVRQGGRGNQDTNTRVINGGLVLWAQTGAPPFASWDDSFEVIPAPVQRENWRDPAVGIAPPPPPNPCAGYDAALLGVRGSGDSNSGTSFPGRHALSIAKLLESQWHLKLYDDGAKDGVIGLTYPAVNVLSWRLIQYGSSINQGVASVLGQISRLRALCGTHFPIVLVGFSQGAQVIQTALDQLDANASRGDTTRLSRILLK